MHPLSRHRSPVDRALRALLRTPAARQRDTAATLRYHARWSDRDGEVRAEYAADPTGRLVVLPGQADPASWWLDLVDPTRVRIRLDGTERGGLAFVAEPGTPTHAAARSTYLRRFPTADDAAGSPLVLVDLDPI
jgi:hypothetical protein